jgi:Cof subfamily protein (haloacid dehalogenase superfamily)
MLELERYRLAAIDLDGTLLRSDGTISDRTLRALALAEARGVQVLAVTARPPRRLRKIALQTGWSGLGICSNGALVYDLATGSAVSQQLLSAAVACALVTRLREAAPGVAFAVEAGLEFGCEPGYAILSEHAEDRYGRLPRQAAELLCSAGVTKLIVQHTTLAFERLLAHTREHAGELASVTHSGSEFVEVAAAGVTKARALADYCAELGIVASQVLAFGDMPNDLPMLSWAGRGIAVANAHPEVIACAVEVTGSNDEDGVACVLERLARVDFRVDPVGTLHP